MALSLKSARLMRVLSNRFQKGSTETLLHFLSEDEAEIVRKQEIHSLEISPFLLAPLEQISRIHYSWLVPIVQKLPSPTNAYVVKALPEKQAKTLLDLLKISPPSHTFAPLIQTYLLHQIVKLLPGMAEVLPILYLPETTLSNLVHENKATLVEIINFLGIHDLAEDIRHVVDTKRLKSLYSCLNSREQQYLKFCMQVKEKFKTPPLGLDKWGGDCNKLKASLQVRGLIRLGKALSGEHPDLIWHLAHHLDMSRGQALSKYYSKGAVPSITPVLAQQVTNLLGILKKKSRS